MPSQQHGRGGDPGSWSARRALGPLELPIGRNPGGDTPLGANSQQVTFSNSAAYAAYRLTFPTLKNAATVNSMQIGEVEFLGMLTVPKILSQPAGQSDPEGTTATFNVVADGPPPLIYQWFFNENPIVGATNDTLVLSHVHLADAGDCTVVISDAFGSVTSMVAVLTVIPTLPLNEAVDAPALNWTTGGAAPWLGESLVTHDGTDAAHSGGIADGQESWLETTVTGPVLLSFWWKVSCEELGRDFLDLYVNGLLVQRIGGEHDWWLVSMDLPPGSQTLRWTYVKDASGSSGQDRGWLDEVRIEPDFRPPQILGQSESNWFWEGGTALFAVDVVGAQPLAYQWYFDGVNPIAGATNYYLIIDNVQLADAGEYTVVITNAYGSVTSQVVTLQVLLPLPPVFTLHPQSQTVAAGSDVTLSVSASGALPMSYRWRYGSSTLTNLILNQTTCSLTLTNVQPSTAGVYTVAVTNLFGRATGGPQLSLSSNVYLTVVVPPTNQAVVLGSEVTLQARANGGTGNSLRFQWRLNGTNLPGATSTNLTLTNVQFGQAGTYTFEVTDGGGQATGFDAVLTVLPNRPPTISRWALQENGLFHLRFEGEVGATYTVLVSTSLVHWEVLGAAAETAAGIFESTDAEAPQHAWRFYRLRSP